MDDDQLIPIAVLLLLLAGGMALFLANFAH